jgi:amino acid transporter
MKTFQRIVGTFAAIMFLAAGVKLTMAIGLRLGVIIFDLVALLAAAICGWIAWRGDLNENRPKVRFCKMVAFSLVLIVVSALLFFLFTENYFPAN